MILLLAVPRRLFCFGSLLGLDVVCGYVLLFLLDIKIKNRQKYMFNVRLAGDHLYGKWLFTWLSLMVSLMVSYFVLSFFPRDVLDEILD